MSYGTSSPITCNNYDLLLNAHDVKCEQGINLQDNHVFQWMTSIQDSFNFFLLCMRIMFFRFLKVFYHNLQIKKYIMTLEEILSFTIKFFFTTSLNWLCVWLLSFKLLIWILCVKSHMLMGNVASRWWSDNKMGDVNFHHFYFISMASMWLITKWHRCSIIITMINKWYQIIWY